jgi:hypothetical protein
LGKSAKFHKLNSVAGDLVDFCQALFPLIVTTSDDHGLQVADAFTVKMEVFPVSDHSVADFERALRALDSVGLIHLYQVASRCYLAVENFRREQPGQKWIAKPTCPLPPKPQQTQQLAGTRRNPQKPPLHIDVEVDIEVEEKKKKKQHAAGAAVVDSLPSVQSFQLSEKLRKAIAVRDPNAKAARVPDSTGWAHDIDKLMRIDGRRAEDIEAVIAWCQSEGCFWGPNVLSGRQLREKFDTLFGQMKRRESGGANGTDSRERRPANPAGPDGTKRNPTTGEPLFFQD